MFDVHFMVETCPSNARCDQESLDVIDAEKSHDNNPIRLTNFSSRRHDDDDDLPEINGR